MSGSIYLDASGVPRSIYLSKGDMPDHIYLDAEGLRHFITCLEGGAEIYNMGRAFGQGIADALKDAGWPGPYPPPTLDLVQALAEEAAEGYQDPGFGNVDPETGL